jgi:hypothetical protein
MLIQIVHKGLVKDIMNSEASFNLYLPFSAS